MVQNKKRMPGITPGYRCNLRMRRCYYRLIKIVYGKLQFLTYQEFIQAPYAAESF